MFFQSVLIWSQDEEPIRASSIYNTLDKDGCGKNEAALLMAEALATHIAILSTHSSIEGWGSRDRSVNKACAV